MMFSGCAGYKSTALDRLELNNRVSHRTGKVLFKYKKFTKQDCQKYLGKDLIKMGYQPVQISVMNCTDHYLQFSPSRVSLPTVSADVVAKNVYDSTASRVIGWGIASCFVPTLVIPAIVDSSWSYEANQQLDKDYITKATGEKILAPYTELNGLIFVPVEKYNDSFVITLIDEDSQEKVTCSSAVKVCENK
jgi:hypothetical protein